MLVDIAEQGAAQVNRIYLVADSPDVKVFELDMSSKYTYVAMYSHGDDGVLVGIGVSDETYSVDTTVPRDKLTVLRFVPNDERRWIVMGEIARYTGHVALFVPDYESQDVAWSSVVSGI